MDDFNEIQTEEELRKWIGNNPESRNLDYKERFNWYDSKDGDKGAIAKDIIALANSPGGGRLIFGIRNKDYKIVGLSDADYESFDQTSINDFMNRFTAPQHTCIIYKRSIGEKKIAVIYVPEFRDNLIICKSNCPKSKGKGLILETEALYIRTERAESIKVEYSKEIIELIARLIEKKSNKSLESMQIGASMEGYERELEKAERLLDDQIWADIKQNPHWQLIAHPANYNESLISDAFSIKEYLIDAMVDSNYGDLPYSIKNGKTSNFNDGFLSYCVMEGHQEGLIGFKSGLLLYRRSINFQENDDVRKKINPSEIIHPVYVMCIFLFKYYKSILSRHPIEFEIKMERPNILFIPETTRKDYMILSDKECIDESIKSKKEFLSGQSITNCQELSKSIVREIFSCFNFNPDDSFIESFQVGIFKGKWPTE
jgi:hypothetical protein